MEPARPARTHSSKRAASRSEWAWGSATSPASANPASVAQARTRSLVRPGAEPRSSQDLESEKEFVTELYALLSAYECLCPIADAGIETEHPAPRKEILECSYPLRFQHIPSLAALAAQVLRKRSWARRENMQPRLQTGCPNARAGFLRRFCYDMQDSNSDRHRDLPSR